MKLLPAVLLPLLAFLCPVAAWPQFQGELKLLPKGCEAAGQCTLAQKLRFVDSQGEIWEAAAGLVTDGASIPGIFQPFVGEPFHERFIRAAIVHDHYCDRHVKSWRKTHRVFYDALIDQGVSVAKAKTMYYAILVGGPKWIKLIAGNNCGQSCVNANKSLAGVAGYRSRAADYSLPGLSEELSKLNSTLGSDPNGLTLEQLEKRAAAFRPDDYYFKNGDSVIVTSPIITE
jgi:Protein of unknown function (DUF1353)